MDVAELRAIYTATSQEFDRVTDHVQRRLKETQGLASGTSGGGSLLGINVAKEKQAAAEVVNVAKQTVTQVEQATSKFDPSAFWSRQGSAAKAATPVVEGEAKRAASATTAAWENAALREAAIQARRAANASRTSKTIVTDVATGAKLTQAELNKLLGVGSKALEGEAVKASSGIKKVLSDLQTLFLRNNFLFRQLGQRAAGDLGFAAVGVSKLAINFSQLAQTEGGAAAELGGVFSAATATLGVMGPLGVAIGVAAAALVATEVAAIAASAGLFLVAKSTADAEARFEELNLQTGLSTTNLKGLDVAAEFSGKKVDNLTSSLGQLQRKLIDASEGATSRLSVGLKKLGIDAADPNRALAQLVDLLAKIPTGQRIGASMQIFGREGRVVAQVVGNITEEVGTADGVMERWNKHLQDLGIHIDEDGIKKADAFNKQWAILGEQIGSAARIIGEEALPTVLKVATQFSGWLATNRVLVADWAKSIEHAAEKVVELGVLLGKLARLTPIVVPITLLIEVANRAAKAGADTMQRLAARGIDFGTLSGLGIPTGVGSGGGVGPGTNPQRFDVEGEMVTALGHPTAKPDNALQKILDAFGKVGGGRGGGRRGEDPAETARRLAEISLRETIAGLNAERDALQRSLEQNLVSRDKYTTDAINLELKRRNATIAGLEAERREAENIRKPGQRAIRLAEINAKITEENRRAAREVTQITDDSAAEQLRIGQSTAASQVRIIETQTEQVKARIRDFADFRIITEQQAAHFEEEQTLRVFNARERVLRQNLRDAGENKEKQVEAQNALREFDAERKAFIESSGRHIEASIRNDAEHVIEFAQRIRDAFQRAQDTRLEASEAGLEPLRNSILTRHQLWDAELQFEITREEQRHERAAQGFRDDEAMARIRIKNEQELAQVLAGIRAQSEAEEELHQARLNQLATQAAEQRRQELLQVADDLADIASSVFDAIGKSSTEFWKSLAQTASNFAKQLRDQLFKGLLERAITGQATGAEGLIGAILNPILGAGGKDAAVSDNTKATRANTAAINALTNVWGGTPSSSAGLSGVLQFIPGLFGGGRASGGPVDAGRVYQIHDNEFFRPNLSGQIYNLNSMQGLAGKDEVRLNVAVGQDAVDELVEAHSRTPKGRRAALVRAKYNRKVGKLIFA